jgi:hypothetical protein
MPLPPRAPPPPLPLSLLLSLPTPPLPSLRPLRPPAANSTADAVGVAKAVVMCNV